MVGLTLAHFLARKGFCLTVIDKAKPDIDFNENIGIRVSAINRASQTILEELGLWQHLQSLRMGTYERMVVWDEETDAHIELDAAEIGEADLGHIIENHLLIKVLWEGLSHYPKEQVQFKCMELSSDQSIEADLLIGADGAKSWLRSKVGIESSSHDFNQQAVVCTVRTEKPHQFTAWQRFLSTGPLAFLPLHDPHLCSIVWSTTKEQAIELEAMPEEEFNQALENALSCHYREGGNQVSKAWIPDQVRDDKLFGAIKVIGPRASFPLHQQHAKEYVRAGIALVGDAAHSIHPLAGQGVNLGFADAKVLAEVLANAKSKARNIASLQTLLQYQRARKHHNAAVMWSMYGFNQLFSTRLSSFKVIRKLGTNWVNKQAFLKRFFIKQAMGLNE
ncbi:MAG: ubiquinone biosynthesis protein UbiH [Gammaproteobacteria bacterium]|nr:ubiquinone biosynthesis protein UbiH [Gammaproteobacteria bacterium]